MNILLVAALSFLLTETHASQPIRGGVLEFSNLQFCLRSGAQRWPLVLDNFRVGSQEWLAALVGQSVYVGGENRDGVLYFARGVSRGILFRQHSRSVHVTPSTVILQGLIDYVGGEFTEPWMLIPLGAGKSIRVHLVGPVTTSLRFQRFCRQDDQGKMSYFFVRGVPLALESLQVSYITEATDLRKAQGQQPVVLGGEFRTHPRHKQQYVFQADSGECFELEPPQFKPTDRVKKGHLIVETYETSEGKLVIRPTTGVERNGRLSTIATCQGTIEF